MEAGSWRATCYDSRMVGSLDDRNSQFTDKRDAVIAVALTMGTLLTVITEILSVFSLLAFAGVVFCWALVVSALFVSRHRLGGTAGPPAVERDSLPIFPKLLLAGAASIGGATGIAALWAPPNTWDSMTYHMSRVGFWIQNRGIAFYATNNERQLTSGPWAEYAIANLWALTGSDQLANLVQWVAFIGCCVVASVIARELGAGRRGQVYAAVCVATLPMAVVQASSTQNDLVVSFWLATLVLYLLRFRVAVNLSNATKVGLAMGLALATKGTAYFLAPPFIIWAVWVAGKHLGPRAWKPIVVMGLAALAVNAGHYLRSYDMYGTPVAAAKHINYTNDVLGPRFAISNVLRNVALHLNTPSDSFNQGVVQSVSGAHGYLGVKPDDQRTTWSTGWPSVVPFTLGYSHEDLAGNPAHIVILSVAAVTLLASRELWKNRLLLSVIASTVLSCLLLVALLKWQMWNSRLHLPIFVLWSPVIGLILTRVKFNKSIGVVMLALIVLALPVAINNKTRPLGGPRNIFSVPRTEQYFASKSLGDDRLTERAYFEAVDFLERNRAKKVGLELGVDDWDYPFFSLTRMRGVPARFVHVNVLNESRRKAQEADTHNLDAVISTLGKNTALSRADFTPVMSSAPLIVYVPKGGRKRFPAGRTKL